MSLKYANTGGVDVDIFKNGNDWIAEELAMLVMYKGVKIQHLGVLLPNHVQFDIERKQAELQSLNITDLQALSKLIGTEVKWCE